MNCQLAASLSLDKTDFPRLAEIKYDGIRVLYIKEGSSVRFMTRNGNYFNCPLIKDRLEKKYAGIDVVLDGEFIHSVGKQKDRTTISGEVNSALHGNIRFSENTQFCVFDCLTIEEYNNQFSGKSLTERRERLKNKFPELGGRMVHNADEANRYYDYVLSEGFEGLILKQMHSTYNFKRDKSWVKMKATKTADLKCTGIKVGKTDSQFDGAIGSLLCVGFVEGVAVEVSVGSGLTNDDRFKHPSNYLGKIIEVKYNDITKDSKTGINSLFLPRYSCVRIDKEAN